MRLRTVILAVALVLAAVALLPSVQFAYATSDSMAPAIPAGAVYVVDTTADSPAQGDIALYEASDRGLVTHRVVDVTDAGYVTKGDANAVADQRGGAPAVTDEAVVGVVPTVRGRPAVVPGSALAVGFVRGHPIVTLVALWLLGAAGYLAAGDDDGPREVRRIVGPVLAVTFVVAVAFVSIGAGQGVTMLATGGPHEGTPDLVPANESSTQTFHVSTTPPVLPAEPVVSTADATRVVDTEAYAEGMNVTVLVPPATQGQVRTDRIVVNYYPPVLPAGALSALHGVHPVLASIVTTGLCYLPVCVLYRLLVDPRKRLRASQRRGAPR